MYYEVLWLIDKKPDDYLWAVLSAWVCRFVGCNFTCEVEIILVLEVHHWTYYSVCGIITIFKKGSGGLCYSAVLYYNLLISDVMIAIL